MRKSIWLLLIMITLIPLVVQAKIETISDEDLNQAYTDMINDLKNSEDSNTSVTNSSFNAENGNITYSLDENTYNLTYTQDEESITFTKIMHVRNGMSYEDYQSEIQNAYLPLVMYPIVAKIAGTNGNDSSSYVLSFLLKILMASFSDENNNSSPKYVIVSDGMEYTTDDPNVTVLQDTEFPDHVLDYTKSLYDNITIDDSDNYNTFVFTYMLQNETTDKTDVVVNMKISKNADFSQLDGFEQKFKDSMDDTFDSIIDNIDVGYVDEMYSEVDTTEQNLNNNTPVDKESNETSENIENPQTGVFSYGFLFALSIFISIYALYRLTSSNEIFRNIK